MRKAAAVLFAALLFMGAKGCSDCDKYTAAADAVCASSGMESALCVEARKLAAKECGVVIPPPPATCADGLPPGPDGCPKTCDDLACPYGCEQPDPHKDAVCKPKPPTPPPTCPEACPAGQECTDPAVGCKPKPTPPPAGACVIEGDLEVTVPQYTPQLQAIVVEEIKAMGDTTGQPPAVTLERLAARLRARGLCAIAGIEAVFVQRTDKNFEEYHAVFFGTGALIETGKFMGTHYDKTGATPPPPVSDACPALPCPLREWTADTLPPGWGDNEIGNAAWKWNAKLHTMGNADSTPVCVRQEPFCREIGLSPYADGTPRASCPMRPDGHADRVAVETWLLRGGPVREGRNGMTRESCAPNNTDNPFAFLAGTGNCRICDTPGVTCSDWF